MNKEKKIIVWVSWWPDSMYLSYLLEKKFWKEKLLIANFNHKFRKESDNEEKFLKEYFQKKWISFISDFYKWKDFREDTLRKARYDFFKKVWWWKYYLALWHNLTDRIETSFINLWRWAWLKWFLNMKIKDEKRKIYRPLLNLEKSYIQKKCDEQNIPYFIDKSNFDSNISKRNLVRNYIFPLLNKLWNNFFQNFANLYTQIEDIIPKIYIKDNINQIEKNIYILNYPKENKEFFIRELLEYFWIYDFRSNVIKEIIDYIENAKWWWFKKYWKLYIFKKKNIIYTWLNLSTQKIKEIWQKTNKN